MIPLISFDTFVNIYLTVLFLIPLTSRTSLFELGGRQQYCWMSPYLERKQASLTAFFRALFLQEHDAQPGKLAPPNCGLSDV